MNTNRHSDKPLRRIRRFGLVVLRRSWCLLLALGLACSSGPVRGQGTIRYEATNLVDVVVGEDLWRYGFYLTGFNFLTNQGLSIFFDYELYRELADATSSSLDPKWDVLVVQPDVLLTADGFLDALAKGDAPSLAVPFLVDFVWLGAGVPGALPYYTYDPNFQVLFAGTTSLVPEPRVWGLLGLGGLIWLGRRFNQTRPL